MDNFEENKTTFPRRSNLRKGVFLILLGLLFLGIQYGQWDWMDSYFLVGLGVFFLGWALWSRSRGLLIPGGILSGIGSGTVLISLLPKGLTEQTSGGIFLLAFSGGWLLITLLSLIVPCKSGERRPMLWPLIPGSVLALVGAALVMDGAFLSVLQLAGRGWPVILIIIGIYILFNYRRGEKQS